MAGAMAPAMEAVTVLSPLRAGTGNAPRFPRPRGTVPCRPAGPGTTQASARPGGREAPAMGGSGAGRGLWPPAGPDANVALWQGRWPLPWHPGPAIRPSVRDQETQRVSPPERDGALQTGRTGNNIGQRPPGAGRALAGGCGPRLAKDQRGAVAGAMAPAIAAVALLSSVRAGPGNAPRFPARAGRCPADRQVLDQRKASARPAGGGSGAGRGLWPPAGQGAAQRCGRGDGPCQWRGETAFVSVGGIRKRTAFPPPLRDGAPQTGRSRHHERPAPGPAGEKRPPGAGRALAGGFGPRRVCSTRTAWPGRWPLPEPAWETFPFSGLAAAGAPPFPQPDRSIHPVGPILFTQPQPVQSWD